MTPRDITINWNDDNLIEKGNRVYRSSSPIDVNHLPEPIGVVPPEQSSYVDEMRSESELYYRVGAFIDNFEVISNELVINPKFDIISNFSSIDAGQELTFTINMTNGLPFDTYYWIIEGSFPLNKITSDTSGSFYFGGTEKELLFSTQSYLSDNTPETLIIAYIR